MIRQIVHITQGYLLWLKYRLRFRLDQRTVLLVLTGENDRIDSWALVHLGAYMSRKAAGRAVILTVTERMRDQALASDFSFRAEVYQVKERRIALLYDYYCFEEYFDNVVFTYTDRPGDNLLGRALRETDIDEEEAVCLGMYCLRRIPSSGSERSRAYV